MQSLGAKLRLERERQNIGIGKIAEDTCISKRYIEAIEADDQTSLPGEFFYRAFVRQYSKYLGWDPDEIEKQINMVSSLPNSEPVELPHASANSSSTALNLGDGQQMTALREPLKDKPLHPPQDEGLSRAWLVFAAIVIVSCIAYFMWPSLMNKPVETAQVASVPTAIVTPNPVPEAQPVVEAPKTETTSAATGSQITEPLQTPVPTPATVAMPKTETRAAGAAAAGQFALTVRARQTTWIRLTVDGAKNFGGTLDAGQERSVNARDIELIVGNAGTLDVIYNGKVLSYGGMGEVKTLLMKPDGWKYKPKPMPEHGNTATPPATTGEAVNDR